MVLIKVAKWSTLDYAWKGELMENFFNEKINNIDTNMHVLNNVGFFDYA
jgi:hypothetical protein